MKFQARFCLFLLRAMVLACPLFCTQARLSAELRDTEQTRPQTNSLNAPVSDLRYAAMNQPVQVPSLNPGSVLLFPVYTSSSAAPQQQNTRFSLTNMAEATSVSVHLFFMDGVSGAAIDTWICLTANQTVSLLASHVDPGVNGYVVAVATDGRGCPLNFNFLVGEASVKFASGHSANLAAVAVAALAATPVCDGATATLRFDGVSYSALPRVLALSNFPSRADGNETFVLVDRIGGDLMNGAATVGTLFGVLYDDAGVPFGLYRGANAPQLRINLRSQFPFQPRFEWIIPAGRSGWLKLYNTTQDVALIGASFIFNAYSDSGLSNQGHNLHALSLTTSASLTIPVFPPAC